MNSASVLWDDVQTERIELLGGKSVEAGHQLDGFPHQAFLCVIEIANRLNVDRGPNRVGAHRFGFLILVERLPLLAMRGKPIARRGLCFRLVKRLDALRSFPERL